LFRGWGPSGAPPYSGLRRIVVVDDGCGGCVARDNWLIVCCSLVDSGRISDCSSRLLDMSTVQHNHDSKDKANLAVGGIAFAFARWQQQFAIACFGCGFNPKISPSLEGSGTPMCHWTPCMYLNQSSGLSRVHKRCPLFY